MSGSLTPRRKNILCDLEQGMLNWWACDKCSNYIEQRALSTWESSHQADMYTVEYGWNMRKRKCFGTKAFGSARLSADKLSSLAPTIVECVFVSILCGCVSACNMLSNGFHLRARLCEFACEWCVVIESSLRCLISDRLDWSAQGERDIQLVLSCCKLTQ